VASRFAGKDPVTIVAGISSTNNAWIQAQQNDWNTDILINNGIGILLVRGIATAIHELMNWTLSPGVATLAG
jgi:hypothetical protein